MAAAAACDANERLLALRCRRRLKYCPHPCTNAAGHMASRPRSQRLSLAPFLALLNSENAEVDEEDAVVSVRQ